MLIKLAALGALGYAGYRYLQKDKTDEAQTAALPAVAGGPLSRDARVQSVPPVV